MQSVFSLCFGFISGLSRIGLLFTTGLIGVCFMYLGCWFEVYSVLV